MTRFAETAAGVLFEKERTSPRRQKWLNEAALLYVGPGPGAEGGFKINLHSSCVGFRGSDSGRVGAGSAGVSTCLLFGCNQSSPPSPRREWTTIWLLYQLAGGGAQSLLRHLLAALQQEGPHSSVFPSRNQILPLHARVRNSSCASLVSR